METVSRVTINKILSNKNGHSIVVAQVLGNDSDYGGAKDFGGDRVTKVGKVYKTAWWVHPKYPCLLPSQGYNHFSNDNSFATFLQMIENEIGKKQLDIYECLLFVIWFVWLKWILQAGKSFVLLPILSFYKI